MDKTIEIIGSSLNRRYHSLKREYTEVMCAIGKYSFEDTPIDKSEIEMTAYDNNEYIINSFDASNKCDILINAFDADKNKDIILHQYEYDNLIIFNTIVNAICILEFPDED